MECNKCHAVSNESILYGNILLCPQCYTNRHAGLVGKKLFVGYISPSTLNFRWIKHAIITKVENDIVTATLENGKTWVRTTAQIDCGLIRREIKII